MADLAVVASNNVGVMIGNGDGTFKPPVNYTAGKAVNSIAVGDFNGDGRADLAVTNGSGNNVSVLLGNGNGTFQPPVNYSAGSGTAGIVVGDFNGDGLPDLAVGNAGGNNVSVLAGNGDGTFKEAVNYSTGAGPLGMVVADLNGDGRSDLAVANYYMGSNVGVLLGSPAPVVPVITGVVNGASFALGIAANSWITIQGTNLSTVTDTWAKAIVNGQLPTSLDGVRVSVAGQPAYVYYISATQINVVAPNVGAGSLPVIVTNSLGASAAFSTTAQTVSPAFFLASGAFIVATRQDFSLAIKDGTFPGAATVAAKPGDVIILWGTGFGPTTPAIPVGVQVPGDATYSVAGVSVMVGSTPAQVFGTALAPGFAALYQVAIQIPSTLANGDYPIVATINGSPSPATALITVQK